MIKINLKSMRSGAGGIFFLASVTMAAFIMLIVTDVSRSSTVKSIADNIAYVTATNIAIASYNNSMDSYDITISSESGTIGAPSNFKPLKDFNDMFRDYGFVKNNNMSGKIDIKWDGKNTAIVNIYEFESYHGKMIKPDLQVIVIE